MPSRSKVEALRSFASKVWCASREIYKGAEGAKVAKGKFYLSKRRSLLTVTNYSLLITNYFCPFGLLGPLGPFSVAVAFSKRYINILGSTP